MVLDREDHRKGSIEPVCYQFENVFVRCWIGVVFGEVLMYYDRHKKIIWYSSMHRDQPLPDSYRNHLDECLMDYANVLGADID